MTAVVQINEVEIERTTVKVTIPDDDVARLMYYLNCVCEVIDYKDNTDIQRFISYENWYRLSVSEKKALIDLCNIMQPSILKDKVFFLAPELCVNFDNEFYKINQVQNQLLAAETIMIAGTIRRVNKIMVYKQVWMQKYYIGPMQRLKSRLNNSTTLSVTHKTQSSTVSRPVYVTQPVPVKSSNTKKYICIGCCIFCVIFVIVPTIIVIVVSAINSKR